MEHNTIPYASEKLQQLLDFVNANYPLPQQPVEEVLEQLKQLAEAVCSEISENMAGLHGLDTDHYASWADEKLYQINVYGYQMFMVSHSEDPLLNRIGLKPREDDADYQLGKIISEGMTKKQRKERFKFCQDLGDKYLEIIHGVADHLEEQHVLARKVELLSQDKDQYISEKLERKHQDFYFQLLERLLDQGDADLGEKLYKDLPFFLGNFYKNQKTELANNFHKLPESITRPYLAQMKELLSGQLLQARLAAPQCINLKSFREDCIEQLEDLCLQTEQYQERQALHPYTKDHNELLPKGEPFVQFLLFRSSGMLTALMENDMLEFEDKITGAAMLMDMSQSQFTEFVTLTQQPVNCWNREQQQQLALVEEYMERMSAMKDYDYAVEKG